MLIANICKGKKVEGGDVSTVHALSLINTTQEQSSKKHRVICWQAYQEVMIS